MYQFGLLVVLVVSVNAFYGPGDDVVELTPDNFDANVVNSDSIWLVEFYAPWCGHCKNLTPDWKKVATALKGIVKVGAVDADKHNSLGGKYGVRGFPTIKVFGADKSKPTAYESGRDAASLVKAGLDAAGQLARDRLAGKAGSGGGSKSGSGGGSKSGSGSGSKDDVIELTDSNFEDIVFGTDDLVMVEFFAPWCGHCKNLAPEWARAASELKGKVKLAALDATVHTVQAGRYNIRGYPTIKVFPAGKKSSPQDAVDYDGPRDSAGIVAYALDKVSENIPPPELAEITGQDTYNQACEKGLCVIAFLPIIYDCQSKCRNEHLQMLRDLADKHKKKMWGWAWAEGTAQPDLENALGVGGFGYPAMVALNAKKEKYAMFKGSFGADGIHDFLRSVAVGRGGSFSITAPPKIHTIDPWDGKDKEIPTEEKDEL